MHDPTRREGVRAATDGEGVDVVLNSLSGDVARSGRLKLSERHWAAGLMSYHVVLCN